MASSEFSSPPNATGVSIPNKTTGAATNTGTNDTDFITPKALADSCYDITPAANAAARLALTGLRLGAEVYQTDNGFTYKLLVVGGEADSASWLVTPKVYKALLTQSAAGDPIASEAVNSVGTVVWDYVTDGAFSVTKAGAFAGKVIPFMCTNDGDFGAGGGGTSMVGFNGFIKWSDDELRLILADEAGNPPTSVNGFPVAFEIYP